MNNVIEFPGNSNKQCPKCGGEWWHVEAVIISKEDDSIGGYSGEPVCYDCIRGDLFLLDNVIKELEIDVDPTD